MRLRGPSLRLRQVALALYSFVVALAFAETSVRYLVPGSTAVRLSGIRSRQLHHVYPPHARMYMGRFDGRHTFVETNEDGLRTAYSKQTFATHDERIIVLGDSFAFGLGVAAEESLAARLEAQLRDELGTRSVAVLNAGIVSYSPVLAKLQLESRLLPYRPTLVVLLLDATDIGDDFFYEQQAEKSPDGMSFAGSDGRPVRYRGALFELLRPHRAQLEAPFRFASQLIGRFSGSNVSANRSPRSDYYRFRVNVGDIVETNRFFIYRHRLEATRPFFDATMRHIDGIAELATRLGARFALVVSPRYHHWNARECPENWEKDAYALNEPYQYEYLRYFDETTRPYPIVNLLPDFRKTSEYPLVFRQDPHWNPAGHAFAARAVAAHLRERSLLPAARRR
jgi:hypothetical protein